MQASKDGTVGRGNRRRARALAVVGATVAALVVWTIGEPVLGHDLVVRSGGQEAQDVGAGAVGAFALLQSLLGWAVLAGLERATAHAARIWTAGALTLLVLSFLPLTGLQATGGSKVVLVLAHVAVGAVLIPVLWRTATARRAGLAGGW